MQQSTEKDNTSQQKNNIKINPVSGDIEFDVGDVRVSGGKFGKSPNVSFTLMIDYQDRFEKKQQALCDILDEGRDLQKDGVRDLVLTANKAVHQESAESKD